MEGLAALKARVRTVWPMLDERTRRLTAANEARAWGPFEFTRRAIWQSARRVAYHKSAGDLPENARARLTSS